MARILPNIKGCRASELIFSTNKRGFRKNAKSSLFIQFYSFHTTLYVLISFLFLFSFSLPINGKGPNGAPTAGFVYTDFISYWEGNFALVLPRRIVWITSWLVDDYESHRKERCVRSSCRFAYSQKE